GRTNRRAMTTPFPLVFDEPRRAKKPPRHLADLSGAERRTAATELGEPPFRAPQASQHPSPPPPAPGLGEPAFRARQLSNHYFARLVDDPELMTDLPAASRGRLVAELLPPLLTKAGDLECDGGTPRKTDRKR